MTRLEYWLRAKTQYSIHSPFVYDLYREVLFARLPRHSVATDDGTSQRFQALLFKLADHYRLHVQSNSGGIALLEGNDTIGHVLVFDQPHASHSAETLWQQMMADESYRVSIDIYDVGLLFSNSRLHRQHFILR